MARPVANIEVTVDTFAMWVTRTNVLLDALSTEIITANASYANTGNTGTPRIAQLIGKFGANTLIASDELRGGNVSSSANLNMTSNVVVGAVTFNSAANSIYSNTQFFTANVQANGATLNIFGATLNVTSNATVTAANIALKSNSSVTAISVTGNSSATNTAIGGTALNIAANAAVTGTNHTIAGNVNFDTGVLFVDGTNNRVGVGNTAPDATLAVTGTANVSGATRIGAALTVVGAAAVSNTLATGNTTVTGFLNVSTTAQITGAATIANTLATGNTTVTGFVNVSGAANVAGVLTATANTALGNNVTIAGQTTFMNNYVVDVSSNTNIGSNAANRIVYTFPKATFKGAKIMAMASNSGNNQMAEMVVVHDNTTAYLTSYAVVASPPGGNNAAPLGTFTANINSTVVEILMNQVISNSAVTVVAHLIK